MCRTYDTSKKTNHVELVRSGDDFAGAGIQKTKRTKKKIKQCAVEKRGGERIVT